MNNDGLLHVAWNYFCSGPKRTHLSNPNLRFDCSFDRFTFSDFVIFASASCNLRYRNHLLSINIFLNFSLYEFVSHPSLSHPLYTVFPFLAQIKLKRWPWNQTASPCLLRQVLFFKDIPPGPHETQLRYRLIHFWEARNPTKRTLTGLEMLLTNLVSPDFILIIVVFFNLF